MVMMVTVALMVRGDVGAVAELVGLELRNPFGGFRMLGKFVYHTLPKVPRDASSMSEKDRSRSLNQMRKEAL